MFIRADFNMFLDHHHHSHENHKEETVTQEEKEPQIIGLVEQEMNIPNKKPSSNTATGFVSRVSSIPVVQDSLSTVQAIASKTSLGRLALSTANNTFTTVSKYTSQPKYVQTYYESYIQPQIEKADAFGCRSLDFIETKFPVVSQPTEDIVRAVTAPSYQIVDGVKVRIDSIKQPAHQVAKEANKRFGSVVDNVEAVINRYLPPAEAKQQDRTIDEANQAVRAYYLLNEATLRLTQRVQDQVKTTTAQIPRSPSDLARIAETSALIQKATLNIQSLQETLAVYAQAAQQRLPPAVTERVLVLHATTQERIQGLTQQVSTQLQQVMGYIKVQSSETPEWLRSRISSLVDIANKQVELVRNEYSRKDINSFDKARNVAQGFQSQVLPVLETIQAQLNHYTEVARQKASTKFPFDYLGLNHAPKLAQAQ